MEEAKEAASAAQNENQTTGGMTPGRIALVTVVLVFVLVGIIGVGYVLVVNPVLTSILRDISIIMLALVTVVIGIFLIVLIFQLQSLTAVLRDEIKPILESANQTADTVRGTTTFLSDAVVSPMINAASYVSAIRATLRVAATGSRSRGGNDRKRAKPGADNRPSG